MASRNVENTLVNVRRTLTPDELRDKFVKLGKIIVVNVCSRSKSHV